MLKGILEGLIQSSFDTDIDMSRTTGDTYNIEKVEIHIGTLINTDKEFAREVASALLQRQQHPIVETQTSSPDSQTNQ